MRIVFLGSGSFGVPTLEALTEHHDVAMVVSQPDRPAGRSRQMTPTPVAEWALAHQIELLRPEKVNSQESLERIVAVGAEANVVIAFGQKIGQALIENPSYGPVATMNLHASLLPKYRGAAPINWAISCRTPWVM